MNSPSPPAPLAPPADPGEVKLGCGELVSDVDHDSPAQVVLARLVEGIEQSKV